MVPEMPDPRREALAVWGGVLAGLALLQILALALPILHGVVGALAVGAFLYVPLRFLERRGQDAHDAGWRFDRLPQDALWALAVCALFLPLFALLFFVLDSWMGRLPHALQALLAPYAGSGGRHLRLTPDLLGQVAGNAAVAFSEEFFYRGYLTLRLEERWPTRRRIFGAPLGRAALLVAALFAVGHLLMPAPFRLLVFFPALVFAWLRAKTGTVTGAALAHFAFNVALLLLQRLSY